MLPEHLTLSSILSALSKTVCMLLPGSLTLWLIISNFSSVPIVFCRFFSWIALGDADLCF